MNTSSAAAPSLAFVVPCYNEGLSLPELLRKLAEIDDQLVAANAIRSPSTIVLVDDGSTDDTWQKISEATATHNVTGIRLSRNHGHQAALLAGLMTAEADVIISLDADLQDDPDAIPKMLDAHNRGAQVVFGVRSSRDTDTVFKRRTARLYYDILQGMGIDIVPDHADYRLMSSKAIATLREFGEVNLFLRGLVKNIGYQTEIVEYDRSERFAGETKYPLSKMLQLAVEGVTSFSTRPLRYVTWIGTIVAMTSFFLACYSIFAWWRGGTIPGWTSITVPTFMLGGVQLIALGIIGEYIGKIYLETKRRPQFIIDEIIKADDAP